VTTRTLCLMPLALAGCFIAPRETELGDQTPKNLPSAAHFTLECPKHAVGAFDSARSLITGQKLDCTAHAADRLGNPVAGVAVTIMVEAGRVGPLSMTSAEGEVAVAYETALPLPRETDPYPSGFQWNPDITCTAADKTLCNGQYLVPLWMEPQTWTSNPLGTLLMNNPAFDRNNLREPRRFDPIRRRADLPTQMPVNNPRDNLVTLIAVTRGHEAFTDTNNNGTFDNGETFIDLTEPFVDANDNGTWDVDEAYVDTNTNGTWDGKNVRWDADTKIWAQERILWTGAPAMQDTFAPEPVLFGPSQPVVLTCPNQTAGMPCTQAGPAATASLYIADPWFNTPARSSPSDGCSADAVASSPVAVTLTNAAGATYPAGFVATLTVTDVRNPSEPGTTIPTRNPPVQFTQPITCRFTGAEGGVVTTVPLMLTGTVQ